MPVIVDTGFFVALFDEHDIHHYRAIEVADNILQHSECHTSKFVVQETFWLLARVNRYKALSFLNEIQSMVTVRELPKEWLQGIIKILTKYSTLEIDIADVSLVLLADLLQTGQIVTVDRKDFAVLRWNNNKNPFHNLM